MKHFPRLLLIAAFIAVPWMSAVSHGGTIEELVAFSRPVPRDAGELRLIEQAVTKVAAAMTPCTVGVQVGQNHGSGVVISENGYVLTAAHVTDRPGRQATIKFPDGTIVKGQTLGLHTEADGALIKITDEGKWPFAPLVSLDDYPKPGDWCVATGHPGGFDKDRTPPVRLGRVIDVTKYVIRTDCTINSGDSGGPLFDMQGRVIGIHSRIAEQSTVNLHGPVLEFLDSWPQMKAGEIYPAVPESRFLDRLDIDRDGSITRAELPEGVYRQMYDRLVQKYSLDAERGYSIRELKERLGWRDAQVTLTIRPYEFDEQPGHALANERFVRGQEIRAVFGPLASDSAKFLVEVLCHGERVALGTIVEGGVLTKASQLRDGITCKTHDGRELAASIVASDSSYDLALLQVTDGELDAITWSPTDQLATGKWLITPGPQSQTIAVGVSSVAKRKIVGTPGVLGVEIGPHEAGALIIRVFPDSGSAKAGLREQDLITKLMNTEVRSLDELRAIVTKYRAGDIVRATVRRNDEELEMSVQLGMPQDIFSGDERFGSGRLNGKLNQRRDDFPEAIQHDSVLLPTDCGGPVLDVAGQAVGINIARADRVATYALTSEVVQSLLAKFQSDKEVARKP